MIAIVRERQQTSAHNTANKKIRDDDRSPDGIPPGQIRRAEYRDDGNHARRNRQQCRLLGGIPKPFNDGRLVGAHRTVGDVGRDGNQTNQPRLRIAQALPRLVRLEMLILDTGFVLPEPLNRPDLLVVGQKLALHRVVGHDQHYQHAHGNGNEPKDQKHDLPRAEVVVGVMLEPEARQRANHGTGPCADVPEAHAGWLLGAFVPHGRQQDQSGRDGRLEAAEKNAHGHQGSPIFGRGDEGGHEAPEGDVGAEVFGCGEALHEIARGKLEGEVCDVEDEGELRELVAGDC